MPAADFNVFRDRLREAGVRESGSRFDEASFGSWLIALDTDPPRRVLRDGEDGWLIVQVHGDDEWTDESVIRDEAQQTLEALISILRSLG